MSSRSTQSRGVELIISGMDFDDPGPCGCDLPCYHCTLLYPGVRPCPVCQDRGTLFHQAQMAGTELAHKLFEKTLGGLAEEASREALVHALISWQVYASAYVLIEKGFALESPESEREVKAIGDGLVERVRRIDRVNPPETSNK